MDRKYSETSEKAIDRYLTERTTALGGLSLKFQSETMTGFPDRIVMLPGGVTAWVELKSRGRKPRLLQQVRHCQLRDLGQKVYVADSRTAVDTLLAELSGKEADDEV